MTSDSAETTTIPHCPFKCETDIDLTTQNALDSYIWVGGGRTNEPGVFREIRTLVKNHPDWSDSEIFKMALESYFSIDDPADLVKAIRHMETVEH